MTRILLTAGPTRSYVDDVRFLSNGSSGRMAQALAKKAIDRGHCVTIVTGPVAIKYPSKARVRQVMTTKEMLEACLEELPNHDGVIAAAAPCDFEPIRKHHGKIPRQQASLELMLRPTVDVIATLSKKASDQQWIVAFALEVDAMHARALEKITTKQCHLIVVNDLSAIDSTTTAVTVYDQTHACVGGTRGSKQVVAAWLIRLFEKQFVKSGIKHKPRT